MSSSRDMEIDEQHPHEEGAGEENEEAMLNPDEAEEEIPEDQDAPMESDDEDEGGPIEEIQLQNDSVAHFDAHKDSIFCIAQHPVHPQIVATGGGDNTGYIFDCTPSSTPTPAQQEREGLQPLFKIEGHPESVNAITFTKPAGEYLVSAGINGELRAYRDTSNGQGRSWAFVAEAKEVEEINFLIPCPHPSYPNVVALGAKDGSIWVYTVDANDATPLTITQAFYPGGEAATAGAWTPDGKLLCTVSEDSSLFVWDVFGEAAAAGVGAASGQQAVVALTGHDERFRSEGGLYSVAVAPNGAFVAVGGADGTIKIVGLPRIGAEPSSKGGPGAKAKAGGARQSGGPRSAGGPSGASASSAGQAGQIMASLQAQGESVETISFAASPATMMAAGSVDGYITLFDTARNFAVRRKLEGAHEDEAVIKVEFVEAQGMGHMLTSCGNDGVVRRWDVRGGTAAAGGGLIGEWRGHRGGGEGGGILGFVQGGGGRAVVTAGDDGVSLVFDMSQIPQSR